MFFSFENIRVKKSKLLEGASFSLPDRGLFLLQGANGCGKTLLMNYLFHQKIQEKTDCLFIDQSNNRILEKNSVLSNISFGNEPELLERAQTCLRNYGLMGLIDHDPRHLSGGEKRIISLFRGLIREFDVCFIDEPTNDLDLVSVEKILALLREKARESLIIAVSHDDRLEKICDGKLTICNGRIHSGSIKIDYPLTAEEDSENEIEKSKAKNVFLQKQFSFKWGLLVLILASLFILAFSEIIITGIPLNEIPGMPENRMDFYVPISSYSSGVRDGAIPISLISYIKGNSSISEFTSDYLQYLRSESVTVNLNLIIPFSEEYKVYNVEYYNVKTHAFFNVWKEYDYQLSIRDSTRAPDDQNYDSFDVAEIEDYDLFCEITNAIEETDPEWKVVYSVVSFPDRNAYLEFVLSDSIDPILRGHYLIKSDDTIFMINYANFLISERGMLSVFAALLALSLAFEVLFDLLYIYNKRVTIRIFRNMAVPLNDLKYNIIIRSGDFPLRLSAVLLSFFFSAGTIWLIIGSASYYLVGAAAFFMIFMIYNVMTGVINRVLTIKRIQKVYDWRYRC